MKAHRRHRRMSAVLLAAAAALTGGLLFPASAAAAPVTSAPVTPVPRLDVERYLGTWQQLAAIPQPFNLACARDTRADYGLAPGGDITVRNRCTTWFGTTDEIVGRAEVNDPVTKAQLGVTFWNQPDPPTNYVVTAIDPDYSWALVVNPERTSGFVLSRTPTRSADDWSAIRAAIDAAGMNSCLFLTSPTTGGDERIVPLCER
ncbi:lipocalin family protein [Nocardia sp. CC227C]|uniref:lipocalin family protein n=1 Tax=Nocardia sp. CC227C TaxID=3044562 RepID=UPI00278C316B|nr:lipocalin family protein [Nocardia sp. CC227C]